MTRISIVLSPVLSTITTVSVLFLALTVNDPTATLPVRGTSIVESNRHVAGSSPTSTSGSRELLGKPLPHDSETSPAQPEYVEVSGRLVEQDETPVSRMRVTLAADRSAVEEWSIEEEVEQRTTTDDDRRYGRQIAVASRSGNQSDNQDNFRLVELRLVR